MSTTDPTGEGGGGGVTSTISPTNVEQNISPVIPVTGSAVQPGSQQQHPPPSPLSGCYLLVVLPEPHTAQHKDLILNRLAKGKSNNTFSWLKFIEIHDNISQFERKKEDDIVTYIVIIFFTKFRKILEKFLETLDRNFKIN